LTKGEANEETAANAHGAAVGAVLEEGSRELIHIATRGFR
jgi:hypothetical protein